MSHHRLHQSDNVIFRFVAYAAASIFNSRTHICMYEWGCGRSLFRAKILEEIKKKFSRRMPFKVVFMIFSANNIEVFYFFLLIRFNNDGQRSFAGKLNVTLFILPKN